MLKVNGSKFYPPTQLLPENIRDDRDAYDLLIGTLLKSGATLEVLLAEERLEGYRVLTYGGQVEHAGVCGVCANLCGWHDG